MVHLLELELGASCEWEIDSSHNFESYDLELALPLETVGLGLENVEIQQQLDYSYEAMANHIVSTLWFSHAANIAFPKRDKFVQHKQVPNPYSIHQHASTLGHMCSFVLCVTTNSEGSLEVYQVAKLIFELKLILKALSVEEDLHQG